MSPDDQSRDGDRIAAADLVLRVALAEYAALRDEISQTFQRVTTLSAVGLGTGGAVLSFAQAAGSVDPVLRTAVFGIAAALILMVVLTVNSLSFGTRAISAWLQHVARCHIRPAVSGAAGLGMPADLLGWEEYASTHMWSASRLNVLHMTWLESGSLFLIAVALEGLAWSQSLGASNVQPTWVWALLVFDAALFIGAILHLAAVYRAGPNLQVQDNCTQS
jgi:hypothetical protein